MGKVSDRYKIINNKYCVSTKELCYLLDISKQTLSVWKKNGCPKENRGWWNLKEVFKWLGLIESSPKTPEDIRNLSYNEQKLKNEIKFKQSKLESINFKIANIKSNYIPKQEIATELQIFFPVLKKSLQGYSRKIATALTHFVSQNETNRIERLINESNLNIITQMENNPLFMIKNP